MPTRIYEPAAGESVTDVDTVAGTASARRQVFAMGDAVTPANLQKVSSIGAAHAVTIDPVSGSAAISTDQQVAMRVRRGEVFSTSSGRLEAGAVGSTTMRMMVRNPTGSGKTFYVFRLDLFSSAQVAFFAFLINPTGQLPTTVKAVNNHFIGHPTTSPALTYADVGAEMTGASDSGIRIPVPNGSFNKLDLEAPYVIAPGVTLAIQATFTAATTVTATADFWQE